MASAPEAGLRGPVSPGRWIAVGTRFRSKRFELVGRQSMTGKRISRRRLLRGTLGLVAGELAYRVAGRSVFASETIGLDATSRTIEVNGKAVKAYALLNASGAPGLSFTVGDAFKVRLNNRLAEPTLIHWHGLKPPSAQDGVPLLSQDPIAAGASYDYDF